MERKLAWRRAWKHTLFLLWIWITIAILYTILFRYQEPSWQLYAAFAWLIVVPPLFIGLFLWEALRKDDSTEQGSEGTAKKRAWRRARKELIWNIAIWVFAVLFYFLFMHDDPEPTRSVRAMLMGVIIVPPAIVGYFLWTIFTKYECPEEGNKDE